MTSVLVSIYTDLIRRLKLNGAVVIGNLQGLTTLIVPVEITQQREQTERSSNVERARRARDACDMTRTGLQKSGGIGMLFILVKDFVLFSLMLQVILWEGAVIRCLEDERRVERRCDIRTFCLYARPIRFTRHAAMYDYERTVCGCNHERTVVKA